MITTNLVNSIGLALDIIGAVLLWRYGLPESVSRTGSVNLILQQADDSEVRKGKRFDKLAGLGIGLLVLGFSLQLISNYLPGAT